MEKLRDYLTSLHVATDSEELFVLVIGDNLSDIILYFSYYWKYLSVHIFSFKVLKGVDDAIQKVSRVEIFEIICENYRQLILVLFQQHQTAPKLCVHQDDQVRRGWSAKTETENYTTICEVNSQFVLGEAIKHETNSNYLWWYDIQFSFLFFLKTDDLNLEFSW